MSVEAHVAELRKKHEALSQLIETEQRHPSASDLEIGKLKKERLRLKEEIARLNPALH